MKEPLHEIIKKYRIIYILVISFLMWLTYDVWNFTKANISLLTDWQLLPLATAFSSLIAGLFAAAKQTSSRVEKDEVV